MKRFFAFFMTVVLVVAMSVPAFAATLGEFITSPSRVPAPELIDYSNANHECTAKLVITPYAERHTLPTETREMIEAAYNEIVNSSDITSDLNTELAKLANDAGIDPKDLAIGDLFDISYYDCPLHSGHNGFTITLKPEVFDNFVGIMHRNNGNWEVLKATANADDKTITFFVDDLSPFAIVYNTNPKAPTTGDSSNMWIYIVLMVASVSALGVVGYKLGKREN